LTQIQREGFIPGKLLQNKSMEITIS